MDYIKELVRSGQEEENKTKNNGLKIQEIQSKKKGRRKKNQVHDKNEMKKQCKYFIDVSKNKEHCELIQNILNLANNKSYGREIILKELVLIALPKVTSKEIEKLQENSLSEMERVTMALDDYNNKSENKLTLGEFLVKKLSL